MPVELQLHGKEKAEIRAIESAGLRALHHRQRLGMFAQGLMHMRQQGQRRAIATLHYRWMPQQRMQRPMFANAQQRLRHTATQRHIVAHIARGQA